MKDHNNSEILIYQSENGMTKIDVRFKDETVWLTQSQLCELYQTRCKIHNAYQREM